MRQAREKAMKELWIKYIRLKETRDKRLEPMLSTTARGPAKQSKLRRLIEAKRNYS